MPPGLQLKDLAIDPEFQLLCRMNNDNFLEHQQPKWLIIDMSSVFCKVGTEPLYAVQIIRVLEGLKVSDTLATVGK